MIGYLTSHALGFHEASAYSLGVVDQPLSGDEQFKGMLVIPYLTPAGPRGLKFRNLNGDKAKFLQHAGQKPRLYNVGAFFRAEDTIALAEGEIDAIAATEHLGIPTMGIPGAEMWKGDIWGPLFKDFQRVIIFADGDDAGRRVASQVAGTIGWRVQVIQCPKGEDVSSMIAGGRADELRERLDMEED